MKYNVFFKWYVGFLAIAAFFSVVDSPVGMGLKQIFSLMIGCLASAAMVYWTKKSAGKLCDDSST